MLHCTTLVTVTCCLNFSGMLPQDQLLVLNDFSQRIADVNDLRVGGAENSRPVLDLLRKFRDRKASDPRDKVFALLNLVHDEHDRECQTHSTNKPTDSHCPGLIVPDYSQDVVDVYSEATLYCIYRLLSQTAVQ